MKKLLCIALLALTPAFAQEAPSEAVKKQALFRAYYLNGNSMVGWGSIDLSHPNIAVMLSPSQAETPLPEPPPTPVKTEKIAVTKPVQVERDVCSRHGLHKVWNKDETSWNCRRH